MGWHNLILALMFLGLNVVLFIAIGFGIIMASDDAIYLGQIIFMGIFFILLAMPEERK